MRCLRFVTLALMAFVVAGSIAPETRAQKSLANLPTDPRDPLLNQGPKKEAVGESVMVSTQLPIVTEAALQVLREGGNAIDAFITAVFLPECGRLPPGLSLRRDGRALL